MLPVIIVAVIVVPLLVFAFVQIRRQKAEGEQLADTDTSPAELEREFAAAEAYEEQWREQQHQGPDHRAEGGPDGAAG
jgi:hypothetical protein